MDVEEKKVLALFYCQNTPQSSERERQSLEEKYGKSLRLFPIPCGGRLEPLHAMYSKNCLSPIYRQIQRGDLKIDGFLGHVKVRYVEESETREIDPERLSFFNINTTDDLMKARAILEELENS